MTKIDVKGTSVTVISGGTDDYISLTDIARYKNSDHTDDLIRNWLRNRNTLEFLGIWEQLNNPDFNSVEFDGIRMQAGLNSFTLTPRRWIEATGAIGINSRAGRYGGTYAHKDIAFEFASWVSVEFKLYLIKEFQRLKETEYQQLGWDIRRNLARINYRIHTDAIKARLIPPQLTPQQTNLIYASEADLLNMALFGKTAKQWRDENPDKRPNPGHIVRALKDAWGKRHADQVRAALAAPVEPRKERVSDERRRAILIEAGLRDPLAAKTIDGITPSENM